MSHFSPSLPGDPAGKVVGLPRSLTSLVYVQLKRDILESQIAPGERLRVSKLKDRFSVSLSIVREALSRLVADGLVHAEDQIGFRVSPLSVEDIIDITRIRSDIECLALGMSLAKGDAAWEDGVRAAHETVSALVPGGPDAAPEALERYGAADRDFHTALVAACGSPWLMRFRTTLYDQVIRYCHYARVLALPLSNNVAAEHDELVAAALDRDVERARSLVVSHFHATSARITQALADRADLSTSRAA